MLPSQTSTSTDTVTFGKNTRFINDIRKGKANAARAKNKIKEKKKKLIDIPGASDLQSVSGHKTEDAHSRLESFRECLQTARRSVHNLPKSKSRNDRLTGFREEFIPNPFYFS